MTQWIIMGSNNVLPWSLNIVFRVSRNFVNQANENLQTTELTLGITIQYGYFTRVFLLISIPH